MPKTPHQHKRNKPTCPSLKSEARIKKEEIRHKTTPLPNFTIHPSPFNAPRGGGVPASQPSKIPPSSLLRVFAPSCETPIQHPKLVLRSSTSEVGSKFFPLSHVDSGAPPTPSALRATSHALVSKTATSLHRFFIFHLHPSDLQTFDFPSLPDSCERVIAQLRQQAVDFQAS